MLAAIKKRGRLLEIFFSVKLTKLRKQGLGWFIKETAYRFLQELGWLLLLPSAISLHFMGVRRVPVLVQHIGHLTTELDTFVKAEQLGLIPKARYFIVAPLKKVSNRQVLAYWRKHFKIITHPLLCFLFQMMSHRYFACSKTNLHRVKFFGTQEIYRINRLWGKRPPILALSEEDKIWSKQALAALGIPKNQWFVCLHVRESGFLPQNEAIQAHRNASIENTIPAMQELVRRGGMVVRMGDATMRPLPKMPGIIDYAHHQMKSERLDLVLCAKAKFFLGCTSGLAFLSAIFGVPVAHTNMIPVETLGIRPGDLSIPKLVWSEPLGRYLRFDELFSSEAGGYFFTHQYKAAGIRADENEPEEILLLVREMLDRLDGNFVETETDKNLHQTYLDLFKPGHYSYGAASRIGLDFLKRHQDLLSISK